MRTKRRAIHMWPHQIFQFIYHRFIQQIHRQIDLSNTLKLNKTRELWMMKFDDSLALAEEHQQDISLLRRQSYSMKDVVVWYSESEYDLRIVDEDIQSLTGIVCRASKKYFTPSSRIIFNERFSCVIFWKWTWFENCGWWNPMTHWHCLKSSNKILRSFMADRIIRKI